MSEENKIEEWAVVFGAGRQFLGRIAGPQQKDRDGVEMSVKSTALACMHNEMPLQLTPAYEFAAPIVQTGNAFNRTAHMFPVDFALAGVPVYVVPREMYFLSDLAEEDRPRYAELIKAGAANSARARATRAGLELPGSLPAGVTQRRP